MINTTIFKYTGVLLIFNLIYIYSYSQEAVKKKYNEPFKGIIQLISNEYDPDVLKDSVAIYALNFKLTIIKSKNNAIRVDKIEANDSLAYKLFPTFMKFNKLNYSTIMKFKRKVILVVPILVFNMSSKNAKYRKDNGEPLVDIMAAVNAAYALSNSMPYSNIKESEEIIGHRLYTFEQRNGRFPQRFDETIHLDSNVIQIFNIRKK